MDNLQVFSSSDISPSWKDDQFGPGKTVQQQVPLTSERDVLLWCGVQDHDMSLKTHLSCGKHRRTNMIGLEAAKSDHTVTALLDGIGQ